MAGFELRDKVVIKRRMLLIFSILLLFFFGLIIRLGYIMITKSSLYRAYAEQQWTSEVSIDARRGRILDRNGVELAVSANVYRVDLDMNTLRGFISTNHITMEDVAKKLSAALSMKQEDVSKILNKTLPNGRLQGSAILKRRIEKQDADKVSTLKINGVMISPDTKRYYPKGNFLAQVIGHCNSDGDGQNGLELTYNKVLKGTPGKRTSEIDKQNSNEISSTISTFTKPVPGKDLVTTIDSSIQSFCEKAADEALKDNKAKAVTILVSDPNNGEILAMVNKPDYNPNNPVESGKSFNELQQLWRNRAVSDTFEPGSVFKVVTATAAMEEGLVKEDDKFNCGGSLTVADKVIHCWKRTGHGEENFVDILKNSCNVGFMTLGQRLGKEKLNKYINLFGFGKKTGIDLNGEATGIVKKTQNISDVDLATLSFGQVDTVSCVQYLAAFNAIANGGKLITPHLMKEIVHYDDDNNKIVDSSYSNYNTKQILDAQTMATLRGYLEKIISEGGGKKAYIDGYNIAGKTGTAQKPINGSYQSGKYVASFGGMAPADKPKVTVVISIDEPDPSNYYAGQIATPVAKEVFSDIFNYWNIAPQGSSESALKDVIVPDVRGMKKDEAVKILKNLNLAYDIDSNGDYIVNMTPIPGATVKEGSKVILYTGTSPTYNSREVIVPDFDGYGRPEAQKILSNLGLVANFEGEGVVTDQSAIPGQEVSRGTTIDIELDEDLD